MRKCRCNGEIGRPSAGGRGKGAGAILASSSRLKHVHSRVSSQPLGDSREGKIDLIGGRPAAPLHAAAAQSPFSARHWSVEVTIAVRAEVIESCGDSCSYDGGEGRVEERPSLRAECVTAASPDEPASRCQWKCSLMCESGASVSCACRRLTWQCEEQ